MIYGLVPVGGKGMRLGLPFPKELLPQKGYDHYNPLINHTVSKMLKAGADQIVFVHGTEFKEGILDFYNEKDIYYHILQKTPGFAKVLLDFYDAVEPLHSDTILFGLPDSIYEGNPFTEIKQYHGVVCGLFNMESPETKVDRLSADGSAFMVKTVKRVDNQEWFWGVLKFDGNNLKTITNIFNESGDPYNEIGGILNRYPNTLLKFGAYTDLGTWVDYNKYLMDIKEY